MRFSPTYYEDKVNQIDPKNPEFDKGNINLVNPQGNAGILTLWANPSSVANKLLQRFPRLFQQDSPLVALSSLYGLGLPQLLANLAYNPQIDTIAVTGNDLDSAPSWTYLNNFLSQGIEIPEGSDRRIGRIIGTEFPMDAQLSPEMFSHLRVERFKPTDLESLVNFATSPSDNTYKPSESDRIKIELYEPEFTDFPSDPTSHQVIAQKPLQAWMDLMHRIDRFGQNVQLEKGTRRALYNLDVHVQDPSADSDEDLRKLGFDPNEIRAYQSEILVANLPEGTDYNYGNRMRSNLGFDSLETAIARLKADPLDRRAFIGLWDPRTDLSETEGPESSVPCLTDIYLVNQSNSLMLTA